MSFHAQPFSARLGALGDQAESYFERVWPTPYIRYGLNRPPLHMASLPEMVRHSPDYLTTACWVEAKGIGRDDIVKLKVSELNSAWAWHQIHPMTFFIWSSYRFAWASVGLLEIRSMIDLGSATLAHFHDEKAYFAIKGEHFTWNELDKI